MIFEFPQRPAIFAFPNWRASSNSAARRFNGGRSSMVEPQIVILVVAGSSPVDHPIFPIGVSSETRAGGKEP